MRITLGNSGIILSCSLLALFCACGGGGSTGSPNQGLTVATPPQATAPVTVSGTNLTEYQTYTFTTTATDPEIGYSVASCQWNFGDGSAPVTVTTSPFSATHVFLATSASGTFTVSVTPTDNHGNVGSPATSLVSVAAAVNPFVVTAVSPATAVTYPVPQGLTANATFSFDVVYTGTGSVDTSATTQAVVFNPGTTNISGTPTIVAGSLDGKTPWLVTVTFDAVGSVGSSYTAAPSLTVQDSFGVVSPTVQYPTLTFQTALANATPPVLVMTSPQAISTNTYALETVSVNFTVTDLGGYQTTVTVDWGDSNAPAPTTIQFNNSSALPQGVSPATPPTHQYTSAGTYTVTVSAMDTQAAPNNTATPGTRSFVVAANALPTATITSPQASGTLPANVGLIQSFIPAADTAEMTLPPATNYPQVVVIPLNGELNFNGTDTLTTSGEALASVQWTFPGGSPSSASTLNAGSVSFAGVPGSIVAYLVELKVTDAFGRNSSQVGTALNEPTASAAAGNDTTPFRKWVVVDGTQTQSFYLNFLYRQQTDNILAPIPLAPAITAANGLGINVEVFQDGVSNFFTVQSGNQASVIIPVRANLPFWLNIPSFGVDTLGYVMEIPNAPTGPFADPSLVTAATMPATPTEGFFFAGTAAPFNPTLNLVTGQGYAPEGQTPVLVEYEGVESLPGDYPDANPPPPKTERWLSFLSIPDTAADASLATQVVLDNTDVNTFSGVTAFQTFPEWVLATQTIEADKLVVNEDTNSSTEGGPSDMGFKMDYSTYAPPTALSKTFAGQLLEAWRVPAGVTDPYNLTTGPANWNAVSCTVNLNPTAVPAASALPNFLNNMIYGVPGTAALTGGLAEVAVPYDPNDPNRTVLAQPYPIRYQEQGTPILTTAEYMWSSVWARPLVLNTALLAQVDAWNPQDYAYYRYSNTTAWPKYLGPPAIPEENGNTSLFDLTVNNGGTFDAGSPVSISPAAGPATAPDSKAVGRFWWTAFNPSYNSATGAVIARTWLADPSSSLIPLTFSNLSTEANNSLGLIPPLDPVVDKRLRDANGVVINNTTLGGYRITWFNGTKSSDGVTCIHPDFWAVELTANGVVNHFLLPANYPAPPISGTDNTQTTAVTLLTDARYYLPSGNAPSMGPGAGDTVAPGYCWFDVPPELQPSSGTATIIIYALKSIMANNPGAILAPRPLNRTDWIDAIKTAAPTISIQSNAGKDLGYAYKVPFNYGWDIVVTNCEATTVAP